MSENQMWILVEGKEIDGHFYGRVAEAVASDYSNVKYEIATAAEIAGGGGGKSVLLGLHDELRSGKRLVSNLSGKITTVCFCVDKDIDDLLGGKRRSKHLVYTEGYSVENYLFVYGDLIRAIAAVLSLPTARVRSGFVDAGTWRSRVQHNWRDWVTWCILASKLRVPNQPTFARHSAINVGRFGAVDTAEHQALLEIAKSHAASTGEDFATIRTAIETKVDSMYARGVVDRIFNGKWYPHILEHDLLSHFPERRRAGRTINIAICSVLMQGLDFHASWAKNLRASLAYHFSLISA